MHQEQETLVKTHHALVKRIAYHFLGRLPRTVQLDDLIQAGMVGLLEAIRLYDATKGASFETYASIRIRGHMLDEVRKNDWVPRSVYRQSRQIAQAVRVVENREGRDAKDHEVAAELKISLDIYYDMLADSNGAQLYGFEDLGLDDDQLGSPTLSSGEQDQVSEPFGHVLSMDRKTHLTQVIDRLPKNERLVLSLYYEHDLNLKEIGDVLEVTESRVSQLHSQAMHRIRARLKQD